MKPLTQDEFRGALQKGLGRAVMHVREHGAEGLEEDILDACLHNRAYDAQCEGLRDQWMLSIIELAGNEKFYFPKILEAHTENLADWDADQLSRLVLALALREYPGAKESLYEKFNLEGFERAHQVGVELMEVEGLKGLLYVADQVGSKIPTDESYDWRYGDLFYEAARQFSEAELTQALSRKGESNKNIKIFLEEALEKAKELKEATEKTRPVLQVPTLNEALEMVEKNKGRKYFGLLRRFGLKGSEEQIEIIFKRLLEEKDENKRLACLWIFAGRAFPKLEESLFDLLQSQNEDIRYGVMEALSNVQDARVREYAVQYFQKKEETFDPCILGFFIKNYQPGDYKLIESTLKHWDDIGDCELVGQELIDISEESGPPELAGCLAWAYEHTPCAICRYKIVEKLVDWKQAPESMLEECLLDSYDEIVTLARVALDKK